MNLDTYVNLNGRCAEAFRLYEQHLGGAVDTMMTFGQLPEHSAVDPSWLDCVVHARMRIGDAVLMGADIQGAEPMRSAYLTLDPDSAEDAERIYAALSDGGEVFMPLQETFFAPRFAQLRDRFGVNWMILHQETAAPGT